MRPCDCLSFRTLVAKLERSVGMWCGHRDSAGLMAKEGRQVLNHICSCPTAAPLGTLLQSTPIYSIFLVPGGGLLPCLFSGRAQSEGVFRTSL